MCPNFIYREFAAILFPILQNFFPAPAPASASASDSDSDSDPDPDPDGYGYGYGYGYLSHLLLCL